MYQQGHIQLSISEAISGDKMENYKKFVPVRPQHFTILSLIPAHIEIQAIGSLEHIVLCIRPKLIIHFNMPSILFRICC